MLVNMLRMISFIYLVRKTDFLSWFQIYKIIITDVSYSSVILQKMGYHHFFNVSRRFVLVVSISLRKRWVGMGGGGVNSRQLNPQT